MIIVVVIKITRVKGNVALYVKNVLTTDIAKQFSNGNCKLLVYFIPSLCHSFYVVY